MAMSVHMCYRLEGKLGRLDMKERKDVNMTVRVTPSELEEIREAANAKGIPYSEFVLRAIRAFMGKAEELPTREEFQAIIDRVSELERKVYSDKAA